MEGGMAEKARGAVQLGQGRLLAPRFLFQMPLGVATARLWPLSMPKLLGN